MDSTLEGDARKGEQVLVPPAVPFGSAASYPPRPGNLVRPLIDGIPAFTRIGAAISNARSSVWIAVSFIEYDTFVFPGFDGPTGGKNDGHFWELVRRIAKRGVDVRLLFSSNFSNTVEIREWLRRLREDGEHKEGPSAGISQEREVAFVGGIGMYQGSLVTPEHRPCRPRDPVDHHHHDIFFELQGPSATDVHHHFVQRWNGALDHQLEGGHWPSLERANDLDFPSKLSPPSSQGQSVVQVQRSVRPRSKGGYSDATPTVVPQWLALQGPTLDIRQGEQSIFEQYKLALGGAKRTIYIENQHVAHPLLLDLLIQALKRGVVVIYMAPAMVMRAVSAERQAFGKWLESVRTEGSVPRPRYADVWLKLEELSRFDKFVLAGLAVANPSRQSGYQIEYVHSKLAIVDGEWFTGGSANLVDLSMEKDHTELNVSVWDKTVALQLLSDLCHEHTGAGMSDVEMVDLVQRVAKANREAFLRRDHMHGHAFALDPLTYGAQ